MITTEGERIATERGVILLSNSEVAAQLQAITGITLPVWNGNFQVLISEPLDDIPVIRTSSPRPMRVAIAEFVFKNPRFVGDAGTGGATIPNPKLGGWDFGLVLGTKSSRPVFGIFLVAVALALSLMVAAIRRSGTGRRMLAVRSSERAVSAAGVDVVRVRLLAFAVSAFIAGIAGSLIGYRFGAVSDSSFGLIASLTALAFAYLGGVTTVSGAVTAGIVATSGVAFFAVGEAFDSVGAWEVYVGGVLLIVMAILNPEGIAGGIRSRAASRSRAHAAVSV